MFPIEQRKQKILRAVIVEYVAHAEPIASELLTRKYEFGVRSATIRNELAEMENMGLLEQPHVSSGRIPSDQGYRYFVDNLVQPYKISAQKKQQIQRTGQDGDVLQALLGHTVKMLSGMTHLLGVATLLPNPDITVRHAILSSLSPQSALLIIVLSNGHVENRLIEFKSNLSVSQFQQVAQHLAENVQSKNLHQIQKEKALQVTPDLQYCYDELFSIFCQTVQETLGAFIVIEGEEYLFAKPESTRDQSYFSDLLTLLTNQSVLLKEINQATYDIPKVSIGKENNDKSLSPFTFIKKSFYTGNVPTGTLALVGPTRLDYEACIPMVEFAANALTQTLTRYFSD